MTFEELSKQLNISVQNLPNLVQILSVAFSSMEGGSGSAINYSTEEQDTGLKWIDGKTIYQKTIVYDTAFEIVNKAWYESDAIYTGFNLIDINILNSSYAKYTGYIALFKDGKLTIGNQTNNQPMSNIKYITIQYTKSA